MYIFNKIFSGGFINQVLNDINIKRTLSYLWGE